RKTALGGCALRGHRRRRVEADPLCGKTRLSRPLSHALARRAPELTLSKSKCLPSPPPSHRGRVVQMEKLSHIAKEAREQRIRLFRRLPERHVPLPLEDMHLAVPEVAVLHRL